MIGLCAICANDRVGMVRELDGKRVFICNLCESDHPRSGRYAFEQNLAGADGCSQSGGGCGKGIKTSRRMVVRR